MSKAIVIDRDGDCLAVAVSAEQALQIVQDHRLHGRAVCVVAEELTPDGRATVLATLSAERAQAAVDSWKRQVEARR